MQSLVTDHLLLSLAEYRLRALDLGQHLVKFSFEQLALASVSASRGRLQRLRQHEHDAGRPLGSARRAERLLGRHVDVGHAGVLAQNGNVRDDVDGRDVARYNAEAAAPV